MKYYQVTDGTFRRKHRHSTVGGSGKCVARTHHTMYAFGIEKRDLYVVMVRHTLGSRPISHDLPESWVKVWKDYEQAESNKLSYL